MAIVSVLVVLLLVFVALPIWVFVKVSAFSRDNEAFEHRIRSLELQLAQLRQERTQRATPTVAAASSQAPVAADPIATAPATAPAVPAAAPTPPPLPPPTESIAVAPEVRPIVPEPTVPTPPPVLPPPLVATSPAPRRSIDWEQFMGAKLFAWLGGFAAFLAVGFFVKYSFEHDLIPPEVRVALGFLLSAALIVGGLFVPRTRFHITAQVLCATGIVSLYAVTFACHAVYHFAPFGPVSTFALMALITATAFLLAVRMDAPVVAILGLLGGFVTPVLLSTGHDNAPALFAYLALLNAGLIAVALHRRWLYLVSLAAAGTIVMQIGWANEYFAVAKAPTAVVVCLGMAVVFAVAAELGRRRGAVSRHLSYSAIAEAVTALAFALGFLAYDPLAQDPALLFGFAFCADALLIALAWRIPGAARAHLIGGGLLFGLLAIWTAEHLTTGLLSWGLAGYLGFAALHTAAPILLARWRSEAGPTWWSQLYPPLTLLLLLGPVLKFETLSWLFWPAVLTVDAIAIGLALTSGSLLGVGVVLVLTLATTGVLIFKADPAATEPVALLAIVGGFAVFFFAAGIYLSRRLSSNTGERTRFEGMFGDARAQVPAFSALLPFALLIMMSQQLKFPDPSPLFGLALLLTVLVLGLTRLLRIFWLPLCALAGVAALAYAWHVRHFLPTAAAVPLAWYLGFHAVFAAFPFVFQRTFRTSTGPWAVAALSGAAVFPLVYRLIQSAWPNEIPGILPALFAVVPLLSLVAVLRTPAEDEAARRNQIAWFAGVALGFITLVFPIQFERQWITLGWAFEGAALLWLFRRVPHRGLLGTGAVLLVVAFVRLALNPAVLSYHPRADVAVFNWYLYAYGAVIASLFVGARWLSRRTDDPQTTAAEHFRVFGVPVAPLLNTLGTVLAFLLLNIEIADYFATTGRTLTFEFSGNFARDMAYTVGWSFFALGLLACGIWKQLRAARYAALALLSVTLLKLFFHDLAHLGQLYRVGALIAVAAVAIIASFLYQRFIPGNDRSPPTS